MSLFSKLRYAAGAVEEWASSTLATPGSISEIRDDFEKTTRVLFGFDAAPHQKIWAEAMGRLARGEIKRLLIIAPPAHAKTNWAGVFFPTWWLGNNPNKHILYLSSAQAQARKSSLAVRDTIAYHPSWKTYYANIRPDRKKGWASERWFLQRPDAPGDKDPTMLAAGVGSQAVLGARADLIIFDDIATQENTATAYRREKLKEWVQQTAFSRETPDAKMLAIMTRWHSEDIAKFFEEEAGFEVIHMPAFGYWDDRTHGNEWNDRARQEHAGDKKWKPAQALWGDFITDEFLLGKYHELGPSKFAAMYQGTPVPEGGALFTESFWMPYYIPFAHEQAREKLLAKKFTIEPPYKAVVNYAGDMIPLAYKVMSVDTAFKETDEADYSVFQCIGAGIDRQAYVLDVWERRVPANELFRHFIDFHRRHKPDMAVVEDRASGIQLIQDIQRKTALPVTTVPALQSKEERARGQTHVVEGAWHLPDPEMCEPEFAAWILRFIRQHAEFPASGNDDIVDTTVMAAEFLRPWLDWWTREDIDAVLSLGDQAHLMRPSPYPSSGGSSAGLTVVESEPQSGVQTWGGVRHTGHFGGQGQGGWPGR